MTESSPGTFDDLNREIAIAECLEAAKSLPPEKQLDIVRERLLGDEAAQKLVLELLATDSSPAHDLPIDRVLNRFAVADRVNRESEKTTAWNKAQSPGETTDFSIDGQRVGESEKSSSIPVIPGYQLTRVLGEGGMGMVAEGIQESLGRRVAVKVIRQAKSYDPRIRKRFEREARAVAALRHPNIIGVHEFGETEDGTLWFAMEFFDGRPLSEVIAQGQVSAEDAATWTLAVARGLAYAHQQGVLHRDIKPENILLDEHGIPKIIDFGLVREMEADDRLTRDGHIAGSPHYMSPEQMRGDAESIGPAADVYAIGCTLYALLTGNPPFTQTWGTELWNAVASEDPIHPRRHRSDLDEDLCQIALKCLNKDPDQRYANGDDLVADLQAYRSGLPVTARALPVAERAKRWARRNPYAVAIVAVSMLGLIVSLYFARRARDGETLAESRAEQLQEKTAEVTKKAAELTHTNEEMQQQLYGADIRDAARNLRDGEFDTAFRKVIDLIPGPGEPDRRGIEWRFLWNRIAGPYRLRHACGTYFSGSTNYFSLRPNNRTLAYRLGETTYVWDYAHGILLDTIQNRHMPRYLADNKTMLFVQGNEILICDANTYHPRLTIPFKDTVRDMFSSRDGSMFGVLYHKEDQSYVELYDTKSARLVYTTPPVESKCREACISPDDQLIAMGNEDRHVRIFKVGKGLIETLGNGFKPIGVDFSPDGQFLIACPLGYTAKVWRISDWQEVAQLTGNNKAWRMTRFTPDNRHILMSGFDGRIWQYSVGDWKLIAQHSAGILCWSGDVSPSGEHLVLGGKTGNRNSAEGQAFGGQGLRIFHLDRDFEEGLKWSDWTTNFADESFNLEVDQQSLSRDGRHASILTSRPTAIHRIALDDSEMRRLTVSIAPANATHVQSFDNGRFTGYLTDDGKAGYIDWSKQIANPIELSEQPALLFRDDRNPEHLWIASANQVIRVASGEEPQTFETAVDGDLRAAASEGGQVFIATGNTIHAIQTDEAPSWHHAVPSGSITCIEPIDPQSVLVATNTNAIYRVTNDAVSPWHELTSEPAAMNLTDNGRRLIVSVNNGSINVLDVATKRILLSSSNTSLFGGDLNVDPDGWWLAAHVGRFMYFCAPSEADVLDDLFQMAATENAPQRVIDALAKQLNWMGADPPTLEVANATALENAMRRQRNFVQNQQPRGGWAILPPSDLNLAVENKPKLAAKEVVVKAAAKLAEDPFNSTNRLQAFWRSQKANSLAPAVNELQQASQSETPGFERAVAKDEHPEAEATVAKLIQEMEYGRVEHLSGEQYQLAQLDQWRFLGHFGKRIAIFDIRTGNVKKLDALSGSAWGVAVDRNRAVAYFGTGYNWDSAQKKFVVSSPIELIRLDCKTGELQTLHTFPTGRVTDVQLLAGGEFVVAAGLEIDSIVYNATTGEVTAIEGLERGCRVTGADAGSSILIACNGRRLFTIDLKSGKKISDVHVNLPNHLEQIQAFANGKNVLISAGTTEIQSIEIATGKRLQRIEKPFGWLPPMAMEDGFCLVGTDDGQIVQTFEDANRSPRLFSVADSKITSIVILPALNCVLVRTAREGISLLKLPPTETDATQTAEATHRYYQNQIETLLQQDKPLGPQTLATFQRHELVITEYAKAMEALGADASATSDTDGDFAKLRKLLDASPQRWKDFHESLADGYREAFGAFKGNVQRLARLADGRIVFAVGREARVIDLKTGKSKGILSMPDRIYCVAAHPDKSAVYLGTGGFYDNERKALVNVDPIKLIRVDLASGERTILHEVPKGRMREIQISPDGKEIICAGEGGFTGFHVDVPSGTVRTIAATGTNATMAGFRNPGKVDAIIFNGKLRTIDLPSGEIVREHQTPLKGNVLSFVLLHDGSLGAAIDQSGTLLIFDMESGDVVREEKLSINFEARLTAAPDGHSVLVPSPNGVIWQVDINPELPVRQISIQPGVNLHVLPLEPEGLLLVGQNKQVVLAKPEGK